MWPWLNYFDVPYNREEIKGYIRGISLPKYLQELTKPENKHISDDIVSKSKIIEPKINFEQDLKNYLNPRNARLSLYNPLKTANERYTEITFRFENNLEDSLLKIPGLTIERKSYLTSP